MKCLSAWIHIAINTLSSILNIIPFKVCKCKQMQRVYLGKQTDFEIGVARGGMGIVFAILVPPFLQQLQGG